MKKLLLMVVCFTTISFCSLAQEPVKSVDLTSVTIEQNNIKREFYCNAQKEIFQLKKKLHFFYWCLYSVIVLILGHYLSKKFLE